MIGCSNSASAAARSSDPVQRAFHLRRLERALDLLRGRIFCGKTIVHPRVEPEDRVFQKMLLGGTVGTA
jgi:hypothetical protein